MNDFETFYRLHLRLVSVVALARSGDLDQAEDLTQETFYRAWQHYDLLCLLASQAQRAWLVRTLSRLVVDGWRRLRLVSTAEPPQQESSPLSERVAMRLDVAQALSTLDESDRQLVVMRYVLGMNSREIGELLEMPEGTVRSRLQTCRKRLAEQLAGWSIEECRS